MARVRRHAGAGVTEIGMVVSSCPMKSSLIRYVTHFQWVTFDYQAVGFSSRACCRGHLKWQKSFPKQADPVSSRNLRDLLAREATLLHGFQDVREVNRR